MVTYKTLTNPNVLETYSGELLISQSAPLDYADWSQFADWVQYFTTSEPWSPEFLYSCYQQETQQ
jgi:hypothetical protein